MTSLLKRSINPRVGFFLALMFLAVPLRAATTFRFTSTSDSHTYYSNFAHVLSEINARVGGPGDFHITSGDAVPDSDNYAEIVNAFGASVTWYPTLGNHDLESQENIDWLHAYCAALPGTIHPGPDGTSLTAYSFDHFNAHFVVVNEYFYNGLENGIDGDIADDMYNWLAADLNANTQPALFVFGHEPAFPQNRHVGDSLDQYPAHRDRFWSLLEEKNVLAFIVGHTHFFSAVQPNAGKTWQINPGSGGYDMGDGLAFLDATVSDCDVRYDIWRGGTSGAMTLAYTIYQNLPACPTNTPTETPSPTDTPTETPTDTATPTETSSETSTETATDSTTPTASMTPTMTLTVTLTGTPTVIHTVTVTPSSTNSATLTATTTLTNTMTVSPTPTPSATEIPSETPNFTLTPTITPYPEEGEYRPFPNPNDMSKTLSFYYSVGSDTDQVNLKIFTTASRKIHEERNLPAGPGQHLYRLDWAKAHLNIANGLYFVLIYWKKGSTETHRVMKVIIRR
jgi:hypothetical protein